MVFKGKRAKGIKLHGAGCVFSAAITAYLAKGMSVEKAVREAKRFINIAIKKISGNREGEEGAMAAWYLSGAK